jgi:hypothetical protein
VQPISVSNCHLLLFLLVSAALVVAGFHEFAEFVAEDVGTVDSGLNSMVLANNNEMVLLPINEPTFGTKRKSQIQVRSYSSAMVELAMRSTAQRMVPAFLSSLL